MKSRPKRGHSNSSAYSDKSEFQDYSSDRSSTRSRGSRVNMAPSRDESASDDGSLGPVGRQPIDVKSTKGLTNLVQSTIAKLKKKGGCPINSIKQDIKENYGFSLTSTTNTRRLNSVLKKLQKQGKIVKTKRGFKLVPISEARRRRRRHHGRRRRRVRRRKGRGRRRRKRRRAVRRSRGRRRGRRHRRRRRRRRRRRGRRRSRHHRKGHGRKGRKRHRRRRKRRRRSRGRRNATGPKVRRLRGGANLAATGGGSPGPFIGGPSRGGGGYVPRGGSPRIPSRNASRLPSRAPSRLPSRSHSPGRPGFDPRETPPTRSRRSSARASARNSPGPHLMASLDDYDL